MSDLCQKLPVKTSPTLELGFREKDTPLLLFGGCYSNLQATGALLAEAARLGIPPARMICTGDVIAYGGDPRPTLARLRAAGVAMVMGNCEEQLAEAAPDCNCGFAPGSACDRLARTWFSFAQSEITDEERAFLATLPRRLILHLANGLRLAVVHGTPGRINRFLFASEPRESVLAELAAAGTDGVIGGHCGLPFTRIVAGRLWHNPGVIGLPANDGTPRVWFSLLHPRGDGILIEHRALTYDAEAAAAAMRRAGLPEDYAETLISGLWPNLDILPLPERAATGIPLTFAPLLWQPGLSPDQTIPRPVPPPPASPPEVAPERLETLWFHLGSRCTLACRGCYVESSPRNDRLAFISFATFRGFLDEARTFPSLRRVGFTGGEPFLNPDLEAMLAHTLELGLEALVLTNGLGPLRRALPWLERLAKTWPGRLALRLSLDAPEAEGHEALRGRGTFAPTLAGLRALARLPLRLGVAGRFSGPPAEEAALRARYAALFTAHALSLDAYDPQSLVLFPELAPEDEEGEGTGEEGERLPPLRPELLALRERQGLSLMCRRERMVVHRKGAPAAEVVACTLLPEAPGFALGATLAEALRPVRLDHPHCARFCVLGGASCAPG